MTMMTPDLTPGYYDADGDGDTQPGFYPYYKADGDAGEGEYAAPFQDDKDDTYLTVYAAAFPGGTKPSSGKAPLPSVGKSNPFEQLASSRATQNIQNMQFAVVEQYLLQQRTGSKFQSYFSGKPKTMPGSDGFAATLLEGDGLFAQLEEMKGGLQNARKSVEKNERGAQESWNNLVGSVDLKSQEDEIQGHFEEQMKEKLEFRAREALGEGADEFLDNALGDSKFERVVAAMLNEGNRSNLLAGEFEMSTKEYLFALRIEEQTKHALAARMVEGGGRP